MATLLESIGIFSDIFAFFLPFLLVFALVYGLLAKTKILSESPSVNAVVAAVMGFMVALSGAGKFLMALTPYMASLFVILFLLFLVFLFFGAKSEWLFESKGPTITIILIAVIFVLYVIGQLYGSTLSNMASGEQTVNITEGASGEVIVNEVVLPGPETCDFEHLTGQRAMACIMGNPKVLGTVVLLGILALSTFLIVYVSKKH
ncbi:MAG: hypothetical protein PHC66_03800 [Candidatus Nanoarchaeia archaeon]|nr:hypothetical protein [Candidatus Nanoarchaeia archaeon]MDD5239219.1 hypothetical protein [Candidatus Nanoarchaeia archaeon]